MTNYEYLMQQVRGTKPFCDFSKRTLIYIIRQNASCEMCSAAKDCKERINGCLTIISWMDKKHKED